MAEPRLRRGFGPRRNRPKVALKPPRLSAAGGKIPICSRRGSVGDPAGMDRGRAKITRGAAGHPPIDG